jgi:GTP 3',8-cyclase
MDSRTNISVNPLVDAFGRAHTDLRVSVTDRCNIRCRYCMSSAPIQFKPHQEILTFEEIARFAAVAAELGIRRLRLTGGEPLVRKNLARLVAMLVAVPGIEEVAMTTNGILLGQYVAELRSAGLARLNVSIDTLSPEKYIQMTGCDGLPRVLEGIEAARRAGFARIKLNALAIRGLTEDEIVPLARFARQRGLELRFIEFMPLDGDRQWRGDRVLPGEEILEILSAAFGPLQPVSPAESHAPAHEYRYADGVGGIGLVPSVYHLFCGNCSRLRLTADGMLQNCLFSQEHGDARAVLRGGAGRDELSVLIQAVVRAKKKARGTDQGGFPQSDRAMHQIGG